MWKNLKVFLVLAMFFQWLSETAYWLKTISVANKIKHCHHKLFLWNIPYWGQYQLNTQLSMHRSWGAAQLLPLSAWSVLSKLRCVRHRKVKVVFLSEAKISSSDFTFIVNLLNFKRLKNNCWFVLCTLLESDEAHIIIQLE